MTSEKWDRASVLWRAAPQLIQLAVERQIAQPSPVRVPAGLPPPTLAFFDEEHREHLRLAQAMTTQSRRAVETVSAGLADDDPVRPWLAHIDFALTEAYGGFHRLIRLDERNRCGSLEKPTRQLSARELVQVRASYPPADATAAGRRTQRLRDLAFGLRGQHAAAVAGSEPCALAPALTASELARLRTARSQADRSMEHVDRLLEVLSEGDPREDRILSAFECVELARIGITDVLSLDRLNRKAIAEAN